MITRRRFLAISAAALALPARAEPVHWQGRAMGAEVSLTLEAPKAQAQTALQEVKQILRKTEALFSLYEPSSRLSQLNATGRLDRPEARFTELLKLCDQAHRLTNGRFDPTVQPLWQALAQGKTPDPTRRLIGWDRVTIGPQAITLAPGQALTLNGIAQGYATDLVSAALKHAGLTRVLVNIGEYHGTGHDWQVGVADPTHGLVATRTLNDRALATSSPGAMRLGPDQPHILDPHGALPKWSTVTVEADTAAMADALSTAFCHTSHKDIQRILKAAPGHSKALCVAPSGTLHHFST
ncbi:FAD:protein FMN transferase [Roseovarius sp. A21]|uniref:FAD:protein FMN transferase n=1 Tax=Roseovarius bejariae TaxID=2576383 RepID=A0A844D085_9RHOB|nr:FAD:protein FMN transferase [Roseovarius bejariae]MRU14558.1 FAD:protein FMN transferase [Roseovarius bejariae]